MVNCHIGLLYNYIRIRISADSDISDVIQETLLAAWRGLSSYDGVSSFKTWLFAVAGHKINDFMRRRYRRGTEENIDESPELSDGTDFSRDSAVKHEQYAGA